MPNQNTLRYRRPPIGKPTLGARVDWSHPMSKGLAHCYLLNEGGGDVHDLAAGAYPTSYPVGTFRGLSATHRWSGGVYGTNILFDQVDGADINFTEGGITTGTGNISVYVIALGTGAVSSEALGATTGTGNDAYFWVLGDIGATGPAWVLANVVAIAAGFQAPVGGTPMGLGFAYTRGVQCFFSDTNLTTGVTQTATVANASTPTTVTGQPATLGSKWGSSASTFQGQIYLTYIWRDRLLTAAEFVALNAEPYQFLYSPAQTYRAFQQPIVVTTTLPIFVQC